MQPDVCVICLDPGSDSNKLKNYSARFQGCECKNTKFHKKCFEETINARHECPTCRKTLIEHIVKISLFAGIIGVIICILYGGLILSLFVMSIDIIVKTGLKISALSVYVVIIDTLFVGHSLISSLFFTCYENNRIASNIVDTISCILGLAYGGSYLPSIIILADGSYETNIIKIFLIVKCCSLGVVILFSIFCICYISCNSFSNVVPPNGPQGNHNDPSQVINQPALEV